MFYLLKYQLLPFQLMYLRMIIYNVKVYNDPELIIEFIIGFKKLLFDNVCVSVIPTIFDEESNMVVLEIRLKILLILSSVKLLFVNVCVFEISTIFDVETEIIPKLFINVIIGVVMVGDVKLLF